MQIGIQQIQLRSNVKNKSQAQAALAAVSKAGFQGIELNRFMTHKLPFAIRLFTKMAGMAMGEGGDLPWKELVQESGLQVISLHSDLGTLEKNLPDVLEEARGYATKTIVLTGQYHNDYSDDREVAALISRLNAVGKACRAQGFSFLYHNHNCEFLRIRKETCSQERRKDAGRVAYDILIEETDPAYVNFEFDCYWPTETGCDAVAWMKKLGSRQKLLHICDRGARPAGQTGSILKSGEMELGTGNMPLAAILAQAKANGCEAVILEQHQGWIHKDALRSLAISGRWLQKHIESAIWP